MAAIGHQLGAPPTPRASGGVSSVRRESTAALGGGRGVGTGARFDSASPSEVLLPKLYVNRYGLKQKSLKHCLKRLKHEAVFTV